jgi:lipopolysaccharide export system protein LptA
MPRGYGRLAVERLRWLLLAGALVLIAVVVGIAGYGRYVAVKRALGYAAKARAALTHETDNVTYSQAVDGHTAFTLHAAKAIPKGDGKYELHDAVMVLYDAHGVPDNRIYGAQVEYDQNTGEARAEGEVQMDLQPPAAVSAAGQKKGSSESAAGAAATTPVIHVRTSGLVYLRKLGVAATDQQVEIEYEGIRGYSQGAEFDSSQSVVHLLANVRAQGVFRGQPGTLNAMKADLDRNENVIRLVQPVVRSDGKTASAQTGVLHLRNDGSVEHVHAENDVVLTEGTRRVSGAVLEASLNTNSQVQHAVLSGGAVLDDTSATRPMHATARTVTVECDSVGSPKSVVAEGGVAASMQERRAGAQPLQRQMAGERVVFSLARAGGVHSPVHVAQVEAAGQAWVRGELVAANRGNAGVVTSGNRGVKTTEVAADDLKLGMVPDEEGKDQPQTLTGAGHTRLEQKTADGTEQSSTGDALTMQFASAGAGVQVASAEQNGHIVLRSVPVQRAGAKQPVQASTGTAERAVFDGRLNQVTLFGRPELEQGDTRVSATTITMAEDGGDASAYGNVAASFVNAGAAAGTPMTHAIAAQAFLHRGAETMEFRGTDAQPARLWQGASEIEAASVLLDHATQTLTARPESSAGLVHSVFVSNAAATPRASGAGQGGVPKKGMAGSGEDSVTRVTSAALDYSGVTRQAVFTGGVKADGASGQVQAARGVVFLNPAGAKTGAAASSGAGAKAGSGADPLGGSVEKVVFLGNVRVEQPGRRGTGEELLYTAATGDSVLTGTPGKPPHVVDETQGSITGATLVFRSADSTIVVAGEPASHGQSRGRVHTETHLKQ